MKAIELKHPLIEHKVAILRDKKTGTKEFRELAEELAMLLCYEAMRDAKTDEVEVETPMGKTKAKKINEDRYTFVPILRAGLGMSNGITKIVPNAKIGVIGLYRNEETLEPVKYLFKMPKNIKDKETIIIDPMLATGGSGCVAIQMLKDEGVKNIKFLCVIAAPEGIKRMQKEHPDVKIYCGKIDDHLNEIGYIVPGLGDAGDRIFGIR